MKTFSITYRPDPDDKDKTVTVTYEAEDMQEAQGMFLVDYPDQAGQYRETHSPLSNYADDQENAESTVDKDNDKTSTGLFDRLFNSATSWAKLFTTLFISLIGLGIVASVLFGVDGGFGVVENIKTLLSEFQGLTGLVVIFLVYFLFIKNGDEEEKT